jgi:hypothetical protein
LGIGSGLIGTVTHVNISAVTVSFFGLHSAIDQPKSMDMTGDVSETIQTQIDSSVSREICERKGGKARIYIVRQILIRRSQLQPVTNAAAAGGKRIAIRMRQISEARTDMMVGWSKMLGMTTPLIQAAEPNILTLYNMESLLTLRCTNILLLSRCS